ncbi:hypothetical protein D3C81_1400460 [compost metagenome]
MIGQRGQGDLVGEHVAAEQGDQLLIAQAGAAQLAGGIPRCGRLADADVGDGAFHVDRGGGWLRAAVDGRQPAKAVDHVDIGGQFDTRAEEAQYLAQHQRQMLRVDVQKQPHLAVVRRGADGADGD